MGRREMREELQSTWTVYEAREPGKPFRKKDIEDASEIERAKELLRNCPWVPRDTPDAEMVAWASLLLPGWRHE